MIKYLRKNTRLNTNDPNYVEAFNKLKRILTEQPVLKYPNFQKEFSLITDASDVALGAVLQQEGHPICYCSRTLNVHERNYSTIEKELLAIVWATNYFRPYLYGKTFQILSDHQPLKWLYAKNQGKDINPKLQRWLLKLGEYKFEINYLKGKDNKVADFLSRLQENDINAIETDSLHNNIDEDVQSTIHSQAENLNNYIPILETVVNRFKTQIILTKNKTKELEIVHKNKRIFIEENDLENNAENASNILRKYIISGKIGIYSEINDHAFNMLQQKIIELFDGVNSLKFAKCSFFAKDISEEEEVYKYIEQYHKNETGHNGINENYEGLKRQIYYPNLKKLINKYINQCDTCNRVKYDRNPIKSKFNITQTPKEPKEIIHMDVYTNSKSNFLTFIDKFSKFATAYHLENKNYVTIIEKIRLYKSQRGHFNKLVTDNEFKSINIKQFLTKENISLHLVKPNNHTGNSDIERLHNTLGEKIRTLTLENRDFTIQEKMSQAIEWYNNAYHSVTKEKPIDIENGKCNNEKIFERMVVEKKRYINKRNNKRENYTETRNEGYIKNYRSVRHKEQPKFTKAKLENIHNSNIKRKYKFEKSSMEHMSNSDQENITNPDL